MTRVLHILPNFGPGGAERMAVNLMQGLDPSRFSVAAVSLFPSQGTQLERTLEEAGIEVWYLGKRMGFDPRMYFRIRDVIQCFRPQLVHTHRYVLRYVLPLLWLHHLPAVHTVHNVAEREVDLVGRAIHWGAFRLGVTPVAIADAVKKSVRRVYGLDDLPVIPNGIPVRAYIEPKLRRDALRAQWGVPPHTLVVVSIARLSPQKNHTLLLKAFSTEAMRRIEAQCWLVGEGSLRKTLEQQAKRLGLEGRIKFLGNRNDVPELLAASDVFVLSSSWEGSPLAVMEAMAAGKAVVATAVGGVPELVESERTGLLVPPGDLRALVEALVRVLTDRDLRDRLGNAARLEAEKRFDVSVMTRRYQELYEQRIAQSQKNSDAIGRIHG